MTQSLAKAYSDFTLCDLAVEHIKTVEQIFQALDESESIDEETGEVASDSEKLIQQLSELEGAFEDKATAYAHVHAAFVKEEAAAKERAAAWRLKAQAAAKKAERLQDRLVSMCELVDETKKKWDLGPYRLKSRTSRNVADVYDEDDVTDEWKVTKFEISKTSIKNTMLELIGLCKADPKQLTEDQIEVVSEITEGVIRYNNKNKSEIGYEEYIRYYYVPGVTLLPERKSWSLK
jgi:hypothetical protein